MIVLPITSDFSRGVVEKYPALNEGQNIHKNRVPSNENVLLSFVVWTGLKFLP